MKFEKAEGFDRTIVDTDSPGVYFDWASNRRISPMSYGAFGSDRAQVHRCHDALLEKDNEEWEELAC